MILAGGKLRGEVEADETFIGGKARNMHISKRERRITGTGGKDKTAVMGIVGARGQRPHSSCAEPETRIPASRS